MNTIYEPKGRAREYSPLALNIYAACDHGCCYCYAKRLWGKEVKPREGLMPALRSHLQKHGAPDKQVMLSFLSDPYCVAEASLGATRQVLELLLEHQVPVSILTKGGWRACRDFDLFRQFRRFSLGATLTRADSFASQRDEPQAQFPLHRIDLLRRAKEAGLKTWVSFEPLLDVGEATGLVEAAAPFADHYKIGLPSHQDHGYPKNWRELPELISKVRGLGVPFYAKDSLAKFCGDWFALKFRPEERDSARFEV